MTNLTPQHVEYIRQQAERFVTDVKEADRQYVAEMQATIPQLLEMLNVLLNVANEATNVRNVFNYDGWEAGLTPLEFQVIQNLKAAVDVMEQQS